MGTLQAAKIKYHKRFLTKVHAWRGFSHSKEPKPNLKTVFKRLSEVRKIGSKDRKKSKSSPKELHSDINAAWERIESLEDASSVPSARVEAVAAVLLGAVDPAWPRADEIGMDLVHLWAQQGGVKHAAETIFELWTLHGADGIVKRASLSDNRVVDYPKPYRVLRSYLATCSDDVHSKLLRQCEELWEQAGATIRCHLAYLFSLREDWVNGAFETWKSARLQGYNFSGFELFASCSDESLTEELMTITIDDSLQYYAVDYLPTLAARMSERSVQALSKFLANAPDSKCRKQAVASLSAIESEDAYITLAGFLDEKTVRAPITEAFKESPDLGVAALRQLHTLTTTQKSLLEALEASGEKSDDSGCGDLPTVLADPPWKRKVKKSNSSPKLEVTIRAMEERIHWQLGEVERIELPEEYESARSARRAEYMEGELKKGSTTFQSDLLELRSSEKPLEKLNGWPAKIWNPYSLRGDELTPLRLLKKFGTDCLPGLMKCSATAPKEMFGALSRVQSPRLALFMAEAYAKRKAQKQLAKSWLLRFKEEAAFGLIPAAVGAEKKERALAEGAILMLREMGCTDVVEKTARDYGADVVDALKPVMEKDLLELCPTKVSKLPTWLTISALPRPRLKAGGEVSSQGVEELCTMLSFCGLDSQYEGLKQVRQACLTPSLEEFVWGLYEQWDLAGSPSKDDWAFRALGHFGGDNATRKLAPLVRKWPGDGFSKRASVGLDVLCALGTDLALQHLYAISEKIRFKALKNAALERVDEVAKKLGLSKDELADRLVPDLGLNANGKRTLDFGPRQFVVSFDHQLNPVLRDGAGKYLKSLPKPGKSDEGELAELASSAWKGLKKDAKATASIQLARLERALMQGRRWSLDDFQSLLVGHPLMIHLVTRLVWGCYKDGELIQTFRVTEDGSPSNLEDEQCPLAGRIGLAHPLEFGESIDSWRKVFADYEILQPFDQLDRVVYSRDSFELSSFHGAKVESVKLLRLEARGWTREYIDSGCIAELTYPVHDGLLQLDLDPGVYISDPKMNPEQYLGLKLIGIKEHQIDAVTFSELIRELKRL